MNNIKNSFLCLIAGLSLGCVLTTKSLDTGFRARIKLEREKLAPALSSYTDPERLKSIFVKTNDDQVASLEKWKIYQLGVLGERLDSQQGENSRENPINIADLDISKSDVSAISAVFNMLTHGELGAYIKNSIPENNKPEDNFRNKWTRYSPIWSYIDFYTFLYINPKKEGVWIKHFPYNKKPGALYSLFATDSYDRLSQILIMYFPNISTDIATLDYEQVVLIYELLCSKAAGIRRYFSSDDPKMAVYTSLPDQIKQLLPLSSWWQSFYDRRFQTVKHGLGALGLGVLGGAYYASQK